MNVSAETGKLLEEAVMLAEQKHHEYVTPEHLLYALTLHDIFVKAFRNCGGSIDRLKKNIEEYFNENLEKVGEGEIKLTSGFEQVLMQAESRAAASERITVDILHIVCGLFELEESYAQYFMEEQGVGAPELLYEMCEYSTEEDFGAGFLEDFEGGEFEESFQTKGKNWRQFVQCMNDFCMEKNPLIGREEELERTMQILCRKDKNNPLHIGEPGVGKTAIAYELARRLEEKKVPELLLGAKVYSVDLGGMLAGTQYRGDFEKRFKQIMEGLEKEEKPIVYFDEIHNIVGAGAVNGGSFDIANMLKPYLAEGKIRFMGATTYEEYKKQLSKHKSLTRRFQNIDIKEPSLTEALEIIKGIKSHYETFHHVIYTEEALEAAVTLSDKYINERFLPDKAIDLIDEAGAYRQLHPKDTEKQVVDKTLVEEVLAKTCNVPKQTVESDEIEALATLDTRLSQKVFGQSEAILQVVNAVKFSRAGLMEEDKPLASLLFVGPTGVGKTEIAKTLSKELGIALIRFDMSEYTEKHTVAKLIGAPAGYAGYEDGGLLTDAVRKQPHAVLLLDEIEKAHSDIYNVLLQVMDYATLTDNQGRKADFRNVIIIMTSNAGASQVGKHLIGFGDRQRSSEAIEEEVKRVFQPEFRNRLSRIVVFNPMNRKMAELVADKKLRELAAKLSIKQIFATFTDALKQYVIEKGVSEEYGAREIDRVIANEIKPVLVDKILFGSLSGGGVCVLDVVEGNVKLVEDER